MTISNKIIMLNTSNKPCSINMVMTIIMIKNYIMEIEVITNKEEDKIEGEKIITIKLMNKEDHHNLEANQEKEVNIEVNQEMLQKIESE